MPDTKNIETPIIHLNGTGADDLFKQYADALGAIRNAVGALPVPHGRDYYVKGPEALTHARALFESQVIRLREIQSELEVICESIGDQRDLRDQSRGR